MDLIQKWFLIKFLKLILPKKKFARQIDKFELKLKVEEIFGQKQIFSQENENIFNKIKFCNKFSTKFLHQGSYKTIPLEK